MESVDAVIQKLDSVKGFAANKEPMFRRRQVVVLYK